MYYSWKQVFPKPLLPKLMEHWQESQTSGQKLSQNLECRFLSQNSNQTIPLHFNQVVYDYSAESCHYVVQGFSCISCFSHKFDKMLITLNTGIRKFPMSIELLEIIVNYHLPMTLLKPMHEINSYASDITHTV